jgi:SAM-dependent methyltransferase
MPRMVKHIDEAAVGFLQDVYTDVLPQWGRYLDLMSSRYSHLPRTLKPEHVYATGMNGDELRENPQLDDFVVQNLNANQSLPFETNQFDAAMCCVSVQYLERPVEVFAEVQRVTKPGSPFVVSFSNRCFPTKAVNIWLNTTDEQHVELVRQYLTLAGFQTAETRNKPDGPRMFWFGTGTDPLYVVIGWA